MKIGDPLDRSVQHGPQNHKAHLDKLVEYVETGLKEGARLVLGGKRCDRPGKISHPGVSISRELITCLRPWLYDNISEVLDIINTSREESVFSLTHLMP